MRGGGAERQTESPPPALPPPPRSLLPRPPARPRARPPGMQGHAGRGRRRRRRRSAAARTWPLERLPPALADLRRVPVVQRRRARPRRARLQCLPVPPDAERPPQQCAVPHAPAETHGARPAYAATRPRSRNPPPPPRPAARSICPRISCRGGLRVRRERRRRREGRRVAGAAAESELAGSSCRRPESRKAGWLQTRKGGCLQEGALAGPPRTLRAAPRRICPPDPRLRRRRSHPRRSRRRNSSSSSSRRRRSSSRSACHPAQAGGPGPPPAGPRTRPMRR